MLMAADEAVTKATASIAVWVDGADRWMRIEVWSPDRRFSRATTDQRDEKARFAGLCALCTAVFSTSAVLSRSSRSRARSDSLRREATADAWYAVHRPYLPHSRRTRASPSGLFPAVRERKASNSGVVAGTFAMFRRARVATNELKPPPTQTLN